MCLLLQDRLGKGSLLGLRLTLPGVENPLEFRGEIAWIKKGEESIKKYLAGIKFLHVENEHQNRLMSYLYSQWLDTMHPNPETLPTI